MNFTVSDNYDVKPRVSRGRAQDKRESSYVSEEKKSDSIKMITAPAEVNFLVGNTVNISFKNYTRKHALDWAREIVDTRASELNWNPRYMKLVIPKTPFKPGTKQHFRDEGLHITVAMAKNPFSKNDKGELDGNKITHWEKSTTYDFFLDKDIDIVFDPDDVKFLPGQPSNDEATGAAYYMALVPNVATIRKINVLREKLGFGKAHQGMQFHISIAGVSPTPDSGLSFSDFRDVHGNRVLKKFLALPSASQNRRRSRKGSSRRSRRFSKGNSRRPTRSSKASTRRRHRPSSKRSNRRRSKRRARK